MAMNFKVFDSEGIAAKYVADLVRKQMNNNPTSIMAFALNDEAEFFHEKLANEMNNNPVDTSQINVFDYDEAHMAFKNEGVIGDQYHKAGLHDDIQDLINSDAKTKANKGKLTMLVGTLEPDGSIGYREANADDDKGLLSAREIVLLVTGNDKASMIEKLYKTNETHTSFAATNLKEHRMVTIVLDNASAQGLPADVREYFRVMFS